MRRFNIEIEVEGEDVRVIGVRAALAPPEVTENLRVTAVGELTADLAWDSGGGATSWDVYRDDVLLGNVAVATYSDSGLTAETLYQYVVLARNDAGTADGYSNTVQALTQAPAPLVPAQVEDIEVADLTARLAQIAWSNPGDAQEWDVYRDGILLSTVTVAEYLDNTVSDSTSYEYTIIARNVEGDAPESDPLVVDVPANLAPVWQLAEGETFTGSQGGGVNIALPCQDPDADSVSIAVFSGSLPPGVSLVGSSLIGSYSTEGDYSVVLRADDGLDHTDLTLNFEVAAPPDTVGPPAPTIGTVTSNGSTVTVPFTTVTDQSGIGGYEVWRAGSGLIFSLRATISAPPYVESGVADGEKNYKVRAFDDSPAQNFGAFSSVGQVIVNSAPPAPDVPINLDLSAVTSSRIDGVCEAGPGGAAPDTYEWGIGSAQAGPYTTFQTGPNPFFSKTGLASGFYWFRVVAYTNGVPSPGGATAGIATVGFAPAADFVIDATDTSFDASSVQAGQIIEIARRGYSSATSKTLTIKNLVGPSNGVNPPQIRGPQDGNVANIRRQNSGGNGFIFVLQNCRDFQFADACPAAPLGPDLLRRCIKVSYAFNASSGDKDNPTAFIKLQGNGGSTYTTSRRFLMRFIEIDGGFPNFANNGIGVSTNDSSLASKYPNDWQEYMRWDAMWVHNTQGEGFYIGPNMYLNWRPDPGLGEVPLRYIQARRLLVTDTGWSGFQGKSWYGGVADETSLTGNYVTDSVFLRNGTLIDSGHEVALRILAGSGVFARNYVEDSGGTAILMSTQEGTPASVVCNLLGYANVVVRAGSGGASAGKIGINGSKGAQGQSPPLPTPTIKFFSNTVFASVSDDIKLSGAASASFIRNNVVGGTSPSIVGPGQSNNKTGSSALFVGPTTGEYPDINLRLLAQEAAVGTLGTDISAVDFANVARTGTYTKGAFEF